MSFSENSPEVRFARKYASYLTNSLKIVSCRTNVTSNPSSGRFESKEKKESNKRCLDPIRDSDPTSEIKSLAELDSTRGGNL